MLERLKSRQQFLRVAARSRKCAMPGVVLQVAPQPPDDQPPRPGPRYGLTVSRRVGNAVVRNRTKRRLRAVAEELLPRIADHGHDYVLIGRKSSSDRAFKELRMDLQDGLDRLRALKRPNGARAENSNKEPS